MLPTTTARTNTTSRIALDEKANPRFGGMPLGFEAGDANLYRYANNSPTTNVDPSGLSRVEVRDNPDGTQSLFYVHTNWAGQTACDIGSLGLNWLSRQVGISDSFESHPVFIGTYDPVTGGVERNGRFVGVGRVMSEAESSWGGRPDWDTFFRNNARDAVHDRHHAMNARDLALDVFAGGDQRNLVLQDNRPPRPNFRLDNRVAVGQQQLREVLIEGIIISAGALGALRMASGFRLNTTGGSGVSTSGIGNELYQTARSGGNHAGFLRIYSGRRQSEIRSAIVSLEARCREHIAKSLNPAAHAVDWATRSPEYQRGLIRHWLRDAVRFAEEAHVLRGLLD